MAAKSFLLLLIASAVLASFQFSKAAPRPSNSQLLEKSIADYLRHDKELVKELKQFGFDEKASFDRVKRQSEVEIDTNDTDFEGEKPPGFFDRAAKFVVELLQRFLRWINADNS